MEYRTGLNFELAAHMGPISRLAARRRSRFVRALSPPVGSSARR